MRSSVVERGPDKTEVGGSIPPAPTMRIAFFEVNEKERSFFEENLKDKDLETFYFQEKLQDLKNLPDAQILCVFINSILNEENLSKFKNLKLVVTRSTGFDHIDIDYCKKNKILVSNVPDYGSDTVAEYTFGLMISLLRKIYFAIDRIKETGVFDFEGLEGADLKGKTLGVIGTGKIGERVCRIAKCFGMNVLAYDLIKKDIGVIYKDYFDILKEADILTFHVPATPDTYHLFNKNCLEIVKKGVYIVNTSRGSVIETEALILGLENGIIAGAALDVLEEEELLKEELEYLKNSEKVEKLKSLIENHLLMKHPNVLISPHNAFNSKEAKERILKTSLENILSFLTNSPKNLI